MLLTRARCKEDGLFLFGEEYLNDDGDRIGRNTFRYSISFGYLLFSDVQWGLHFGLMICEVQHAVAYLQYSASRSTLYFCVC